MREGLRIASFIDRGTWQLKSWLPGYPLADTTDAGLFPAQVGRMRRRFGSAPDECFNVMCVGPKEWLIMTATRRTNVEPVFGRTGYVLTNLSDAFAGFTLAGHFARDLLAKGSGIDFDVKHFKSEQCVRTRFAQIRVVIACGAGDNQFELHVARSHSTYLCNWLEDAALEFHAATI